jgi:hypothetical protein
MQRSVLDSAHDAATPPLDPVHRDAIREQFDVAFYLACNPDVQAAGLDPLDHFLLRGWREGRQPNRGFDVAYYLASNPDVAAHGINPLLHYVWAGRREGRRPLRPLDAIRRHLEASAPPRERAPHWAGAADRSPALAPAVLAAALADAGRAAGTVVSVSHDNYAANYGGVQSLISDEQRGFQRAGWRYLHLSPAAPLPMLAEPGPPGEFRVKLVIDGALLGVVRLADLVAGVGGLRGQGCRVEVIFHHLMGHAPELLSGLALAAGARPFLWVHDYFTLCPSYALMRNDVTFCGAPPARSAACTICTFGESRLDHVARVRAFFEATHPMVLAPSESALDLWRRRGGLTHFSCEVRPPARLVMAAAGDEHAAPATPHDAPLRVAHLGARTAHKGWLVFEELALRSEGDSRYTFYHLGLGDGMPMPGCVRPVPVRVTPDHPDAMIEAIAEHRIDVVVSWSTWPETFCFAAHEALAGGAFVIAREGAGNVWPAVRIAAPGQGCAVADERDLTRLFASGEIVRRAALAPRRRGALLRGCNTVDQLLRARAPGLPPGISGGARGSRHADMRTVPTDG